MRGGQADDSPCLLSRADQYSSKTLHLAVIPPPAVYQAYMEPKSGFGIVCRFKNRAGKVLDSVQQFPKCGLMRLIPSFGGFVLVEASACSHVF